MKNFLMGYNMNKVSKEVEEIFNIPSNSGESESDDYGNTAENDSNEKPKFEELSEELYDSIGESKTPTLEVQKKESIDSINNINDIESPKSEIAEEIIKESVSISNDEQEYSENDIDIDDIFASSSLSKEEIPVDNCIDKEVGVDKDRVEDEGETLHTKETQDESSQEKTLETTKEQLSKKVIPFDSAENEIGVEELPQEAASSKVNVNIKENVRIVNGKFQWLLNCPNERFIPFYTAKAESLQDMLPSGQINFDKYGADLKSSFINLTLDSNDLDDLCKKMNDLQQSRERVVEIILHVDSQYYVWERFLDLMRGVLARSQYEKPVLKQEGVVFVHMRDMELYYAKLRGIHNTGSLVLKNIDMAWETLSRRVTISMGDRDREVKDRKPYNDSPLNKEIASIPNASQKNPESDSSLSDYDELSGSAPIQSNEHSVGAQEISW